MQQEKQTCLDFLTRTDLLAATLGCDVQALPELIGISRSSLFAYRSGKARITDKAWAKLRAAEVKAGLARRVYEAAPLPSSRLNEPGGGDIECRVEILEREVQELKSVIRKFKAALLHGPGDIKDS